MNNEQQPPAGWTNNPLKLLAFLAEGGPIVNRFLALHEGIGEEQEMGENQEMEMEASVEQMEEYSEANEEQRGIQKQTSRLEQMGLEEEEEEEEQTEERRMEEMNEQMGERDDEAEEREEEVLLEQMEEPEEELEEEDFEKKRQDEAEERRNSLRSSNRKDGGTSSCEPDRDETSSSNNKPDDENVSIGSKKDEWELDHEKARIVKEIVNGDGSVSYIVRWYCINNESLNKGPVNEDVHCSRESAEYLEEVAPHLLEAWKGNRYRYSRISWEVFGILARKKDKRGRVQYKVDWGKKYKKPTWVWKHELEKDAKVAEMVMKFHPSRSK